jgi:hypothetical protein
MGIRRQLAQKMAYCLRKGRVISIEYEVEEGQSTNWFFFYLGYPFFHFPTQVSNPSSPFRIVSVCPPIWISVSGGASGGGYLCTF